MISIITKIPEKIYDNDIVKGFKENKIIFVNAGFDIISLFSKEKRYINGLNDFNEKIKTFFLYYKKTLLNQIEIDENVFLEAFIEYLEKSEKQLKEKKNIYKNFKLEIMKVILENKL